MNISNSNFENISISDTYCNSGVVIHATIYELISNMEIKNCNFIKCGFEN
jgi:hypothetical protein